MASIGSAHIVAVALLCFHGNAASQNIIVTTASWVDTTERTVMTCATPNHDVMDLQWSNNALSAGTPIGGDSIYTYDPFVNPPVFPGPNVNSSCYEFVANGDFPLTIKSIEVDDEGKYWCTLTTTTFLALRGSSELRVRVPPRTITLMYNNQPVTGGSSIELVATKSYMFTCNVPGIKPAASFQWSLDGIPETGSDSSSSVGGNLVDSSSTLTITVPERPDVTLNCSATNKQVGPIFPAVEAVFTFQVEVQPRSVSLSDSSGPLIDNGEVSIIQDTQHAFICDVQATKPAATVEWYLNNQLQTTDISTTSQNRPDGLLDTSSTWTFTPSVTHHKQQVKCQARTASSELPYPSLNVTLNVIGPPNTPVVTPSTTAMTEGVPTALTCTAAGGYPLDWMLDWSNGDSPDPPTISSLSGNRYNYTSTLSFTPRREDNTVTVITCTAKRGASSSPGGSLGPIDVRFCVINLSVSQSPPAATAGDTVTFSCVTSDSSNPATTLTWFEDSILLTTPTDQPNTPGANGGRVTSVVYTTDVLNKTNHGNVYLCCATNPTISQCATPVCDTLTLNVRYPPVFTSWTQTPQTPVSEGNDVILMCTVDANPTTVQITWKKGEAGDSFNPTNGITSTLTLSNIKREDSGYYTCTANNGVPSDSPTDVVSSPITVIVHYEANLTNKAMDEVGVRDGDNAVLLCIAVGNPMPVMTWYSPSGTEITSGMDEGKFLVTSSTTGGDGVFDFEVTSTLVIIRVDSQVDYGTYTCRSSNGIGVEDSLNINVTGTRRPDPPSRVEIIEQTANSLSVRWTAGYDGGAEQSFRISYLKTPDSTEVFTQETKETISTATGLEDYTEYEIRVYAKNAMGQNDKFATTTGYTLPEAPNPDSGIDVKFYKGEGTVVITGLKTGCIQLEVQYQGDATWQECGECITSDQTVTLTEWCAGPSQKRRRRAVGNIEAVQAKLCIRGLCSPATGALKDQDTQPPIEPDSTGLIVGATIGGVILIAIIIVLVVYRVRSSTNKKSGKRGDKESLSKTGKCVHSETSHPRTNTQSPYQEITELEVFSDPANHRQGAALYGNVPAAHKAFPRDQLKIIKELGRGAFGRVLLAEAAGMTQGSKVTLVAVKTLKEAADKSNKADMMQELELMKKLPDHCNVVRLLGFCVEKDPPYIIVEYLSRGNLKDLLKDSRSKGGCVYGNLHGISKSLTSKDLMKFAKDVADGMAFISSQQCIHRDLAARNVLVAEDMTCKVSDFGLARDVMNIRVYERSSEGALPMRWMALESVVDDVYTPESDVWSYGTLLWEIVTLGARPYPAMTAKVMVDELQSGYRMPKPKHCQQELYVMMLRCWYEDPESRPTFKTISEELDKLISKGKEYISVGDFEESTYEVVLKNDAGEKV